MFILVFLGVICMKQQLFYRIMFLSTCAIYAHDPISRFDLQQVEEYMQLVLTLDKALEDTSIDPAVLAVEEDIVKLIEFYREIEPALNTEQERLAQNAVAHLREAIATKAPRAGAPAERMMINVNPRYSDARDEYLRNLIVTGSLVAPNFCCGGSSGGGGSIIATGTGIISINGQINPIEFLTNGSLGTQPNWTQVGNDTNQLNIPMACSAGVTAGLVSNTDCANWNLKLSTTGGTMTGDINMSGCHAINFFNSDESLEVTLRAPCPAINPSASVIILLPTTQGNPGQVLGQANSPTGQLTWINTVTSQASINLLNTATSCDIPNTLVERDINGSFVATTISLTGNSLINYGTSACDTGATYVLAPINGNSIIGLGTVNTGSSNTILGNNASVGVGGTNQTALGAGAIAITNNTVVLGNSTVTNVNPGVTGTVSLGSSSVIWDNLNTYSATFYANSSNTSIVASPSLGAAYQLVLPPVQGATGQILYIQNTVGNQDILNWTSVSSIVSGTVCDIPNTIVARDSTGSFVATTISLTGNNLIEYGTDQCLPGAPFIEAPINGNTIIGVNAGNITMGNANALFTSTGNSAFGQNALAALTSGLYNSGFGGFTLTTLTTGSGNSALGFGANVSSGAALNRTAIGAGAVALVDNTIVLGNGSVVNVNPGNAGVEALGSAVALWSTLNTYSTTYFAGNGNTITVAAGPALATPYTILLPPDTGAAGDVLFISSQNGSVDQLDWTSISAIVSGTSCNLPGHVVARDANGSFAATTITLDGTPSIINYSSLGLCDTGSGYIWAPTNQNSIIGLFAGNQNTLTGGQNTVLGNSALAVVTTGSCNTADGIFTLSSVTTGYNNTAVGCSAGSALTTGSGNIYIGAGAGASHEGNNAIFLGNTQPYIGDNVIFIGNPSSPTSLPTCPTPATSTTIYGCINLPEVQCGTGYIASFDTNGQLIQARSSRRYKDNIKSLTSDLTDRLYALQPVEFNFKNRPTERSFGLIAEQTHEICPEMVIYNEAGQPDSVNYLSLQIVALDALINLNKRCDMLTNMVIEQNATISQLQQQIARLVQ